MVTWFNFESKKSKEPGKMAATMEKLEAQCHKISWIPMSVLCSDITFDITSIILISYIIILWYHISPSCNLHLKLDSADIRKYSIKPKDYPTLCLYDQDALAFKALLLNASFFLVFVSIPTWQNMSTDSLQRVHYSSRTNRWPFVSLTTPQSWCCSLVRHRQMAIPSPSCPTWGDLLLCSHTVIAQAMSMPRACLISSLAGLLCCGTQVHGLTWAQDAREELHQGRTHMVLSAAPDSLQN